MERWKNWKRMGGAVESLIADSSQFPWQPQAFPTHSGFFLPSLPPSTPFTFTYFLFLFCSPPLFFVSKPNESPCFLVSLFVLRMLELSKERLCVSCMTWMMNIKVLEDDLTLLFWKVLNCAEPALGVHLHLKCHMTPGGMFTSLGIYARLPRYGPGPSAGRCRGSAHLLAQHAQLTWKAASGWNGSSLLCQHLFLYPTLLADAPPPPPGSHTATIVPVRLHGS